MKRKILFIRPSLGYGGADRVTLNLLNNYDKEKYDVSLALMHLNGEFQSDLNKNVAVYNLGASSLWFCIRPIQRLLRKENFDVVFSTCGGMSIPMMLATQFMRFKGTTIVSERNSLDRTYSSSFKKSMLLGLKKRLYKRASLVTAVSHGIKDQLIARFKLESNRVFVVNNPLIDNHFYNQLDEPLEIKKSEAKLQFIAIGRFVKQKDYPNLLHAFKKLTETQEAELIILGKGPLKSKVEQLVEALNLKNNVQLVGFDPNPYKYLKHADVFVLSSLHEGMPGVLIQAMAAGVACISTDCPTGPNEIIEHEKNGILVPVGDSNVLAGAMLSLASDSALREKYGEAAKKSVKKYQVNEGVESYFKLIDEAS